MLLLAVHAQRRLRQAAAHGRDGGRRAAVHSGDDGALSEHRAVGHLGYTYSSAGELGAMQKGAWLSPGVRAHARSWKNDGPYAMRMLAAHAIARHLPVLLRVRDSTRALPGLCRSRSSRDKSHTRALTANASFPALLRPSHTPHFFPFPFPLPLPLPLPFPLPFACGPPPPPPPIPTLQSSSSSSTSSALACTSLSPFPSSFTV